MYMQQRFKSVLAFAALVAMVASLAIADKKIYDSKCVSCHKADGKGNPNMAKVLKIEPKELDLTAEHAVKKSDAELLKIIGEGKDKMPAFGKQLKPDELKSVLEYMRSLAPKKLPSPPPSPARGEEKSLKSSPLMGEEKGEGAKNAEAEDAKPITAQVKVSETTKTEYAKSCASCHGKDGKGNPAMAKVFKVETSALDLTDEGTLGKSDEELSKITAVGLNKMPGYKGKISDRLIAEIVTYIRSLKK